MAEKSEEVLIIYWSFLLQAAPAMYFLPLILYELSLIICTFERKMKI
jgi:hypothetical protein